MALILLYFSTTIGTPIVMTMDPKTIRVLLTKNFFRSKTLFSSRFESQNLAETHIRSFFRSDIRSTESLSD